MNNLCEYKNKCKMPYESNRCLNNFERCIVYQRRKSLDIGCANDSGLAERLNETKSDPYGNMKWHNGEINPSYQGG